MSVFVLWQMCLPTTRFLTFQWNEINYRMVVNEINFETEATL